MTAWRPPRPHAGELDRQTVALAAYLAEARHWGITPVDLATAVDELDASADRQTASTVSALAGHSGGTTRADVLIDQLAVLIAHTWPPEEILAALEHATLSHCPDHPLEQRREAARALPEDLLCDLPAVAADNRGRAAATPVSGP